jgi:hypothetical protein
MTKPKILIRAVLSLITIALIAYNHNSEIIPVNDGMGWDGRLYASYAANLERSLDEKAINEYRFQRVLMSVVISKVASMTGTTLDIPTTVKAFKLFNIFWLFLALFYFLLLLQHLKLPDWIEIVGFAGLFWCFPIIKMTGYNPIITDTGAFALGVAMVYHYLKGHYPVMLAIVLIGSFVWPTFILFGLLIFMKRETVQVPNTTKFRLERLILPVAYLLVFMIVSQGFADQFYDTYADVNPITKSTLFISVLIGAAYCYGASGFIPSFNALNDLVKSVKWLWIIPVVLIFIGVKYVVGQYASPQPEQMSGGRYIINIIKQSVANPGVFYVSHIIYFGFPMVLLVFNGPNFVKVIREYGFGMLVLAGGIIFMSLGSESRQLINFYPLLVVLFMKSLVGLKTPKLGWIIGMSLLAILWSRFWYTINDGGDIGKNLLQYPAQRYFQVFGPWMSNPTYFMNLLYCILLAAAVFAFYKVQLSTAEKKSIPIPVKKKR